MERIWALSEYWWSLKPHRWRRVPRESKRRAMTESLKYRYWRTEAMPRTQLKVGREEPSESKGRIWRRKWSVSWYCREVHQDRRVVSMVWCGWNPDYEGCQMHMQPKGEDSLKLRCEGEGQGDTLRRESRTGSRLDFFFCYQLRRKSGWQDRGRIEEKGYRRKASHRPQRRDLFLRERSKERM